jgi:hypothetical protein
VPVCAFDSCSCVKISDAMMHDAALGPEGAGEEEQQHDQPDPHLVEKAIVFAVKTMNLEALSTLLDANPSLELDDLPYRVLEHGRAHLNHRDPVILSRSGGLLHMAVSMVHITESRTDLETVDTEAIVARLMMHGVSHASRCGWGWTPLHWACRLGAQRAIAPLLRAGANANAMGPRGETPLHVLCSPSVDMGAWCVRLGEDAVRRLLDPLLEAGADPTVPRHDGLRPYDLLSRFARFGPAAVRLERQGIVSATNPPVEVAGAVVLPLRARDPVASDPWDATQCSAQADDARVQRERRWDPADVQVLASHARELDARRRAYISTVLLLLSWRRRTALAGTSAAALAFAELPEEIFGSIVLRACPDEGLAALWRVSFEDIERHARVANAYTRRSAALDSWLSLQRWRDESADEERIDQLGVQYDEAKRVARELRRGGGHRVREVGTCERSRQRAITAVEAFAAGARRVLYADGV